VAAQPRPRLHPPPTGGKRPPPPAQTAPSGEAVTIEYWLWDANQLPAYQACADAFMAANPNIQVNITQSGWDDYWNGIQTGMVAGTAPDVFTNHLAKYPEFAAKEQLVDISPMWSATASTSASTWATGRPVGTRRQALWSAQGLGHHRHRLQPGCHWKLPA
jgi:ABC-type glycerol-3-phosphate transport system substrate-binding protein